MEISYADFCKIIAQDYNIEIKEKCKKYFNEFPVKNNKRKIKATHNAIIVDKNGKEHPYMLRGQIRNDEKLIEFDYIYTIVQKSLDKILSEANITLESENCKISEGGGWYSNGKKYFYKEFTCEI